MNGHQIAELRAKGELEHLSRGWYAQNDADPMVKLAGASHSRLGCLSACRAHGLWVPPEKHQTIHLVANNWESAQATRGRVGVAAEGRVQPIVHRGNGDKNILVVDLKEALEQVARFHSPEEALIVIESALNQGKVFVPEVKHMLSSIPKSRAHYLRNFSLHSQSGSETRVAHFLRNRGLNVVQQYSPIPGWYVDMLVGNSWILECDSVAHHAGESAFAKDRQRDLQLKEMGYEVTRLSYAQIWHDWENTKNSLITIAKTRRYRAWPSAPRRKT